MKGEKERSSEMTVEKLRENLEKARQNAVKWQARAKDMERKITEQENMEIVQAVRSVAATPEELQEILELIKNGKEIPQNNLMEEEEKNKNEE